MNILVTGSNGFIGSNLANYLIKKNTNVFGIGSKGIYKNKIKYQI